MRIVPASPVHVGPIAARMREQDRIEAAAVGNSPKQALRQGIKGGEAWTALVDGRPEAMFGIVDANALTGEAVPWMLGTDAIYRHGRDLLVGGPMFLERWFDSRRLLRNIVSASNIRAIRLLERWGFVVERDEREVGGVIFRTFWMERERV